VKALLLVSLLLASCATYEGTARSAFVHDASCPADRVTVARAQLPAPPADVAADPARLALWKDDAEKRAEHRIVVTGCGQERRYDCDRQSASDGTSTATWVECAPDDTLFKIGSWTH